jgi:putative SOS response-associated peptidase YedK
MCGRFTLQPTEEFYERFAITNRLDHLEARYNIAPGQMVPVVVAHSPHQATLMRWGLIPHWAKDEKIGYKMINARAETLAEKPAFRGLLKSQRCLVPASGFYEWRAEGRTKIPYYIHPETTSLVAFAGLYDHWTNPKGEDVTSFTIITTEAEGVVAHLHHRMPIILDRALEDAWLDKDITANTEVLDILRQKPDMALDTYPVSRRVNAARDDDPSLIEHA